MANPAGMTTEEILDALDTSNLGQVPAALIAELKYRKINEDDDPEDLGYRGGTRPTHQPVNP